MHFFHYYYNYFSSDLLVCSPQVNSILTLVSVPSKVFVFILFFFGSSSKIDLFAQDWPNSFVFTTVYLNRVFTTLSLTVELILVFYTSVFWKKYHLVKTCNYSAFSAVYIIVKIHHWEVGCWHFYDRSRKVILRWSERSWCRICRFVFWHRITAETMVKSLNTFCTKFWSVFQSDTTSYELANAS